MMEGFGLVIVSTFTVTVWGMIYIHASVHGTVASSASVSSVPGIVYSQSVLVS